MQLVVNPDCSQFDSPGDDSENKEEEYVCLSNQGGQAIDISGWVIKDEADWAYSIPAFTLDPAASVRVRTGCGTNTKQDLYWCKGGASTVWNNGGDTVFLYDAAGNLVTEYPYTE